MTSIVMLIAGSQFTLADISISNYSDATNDRFTNSSSFVFNGFNLSGIGRSTNGRWATLIDRDIVVSANHFAPSGDISFYADNNPSTTPVVRQVAASTRIGTSDLWIAKLNSPVDASILHFNYATDVLTGVPQTVPGTVPLVPAGPYDGNVGIMVGQSPATGQLAQQDQAFGQNVIYGFSKSFMFLGGVTDALVMTVDQQGNGDYVNFEAALVDGDSGAPFFIVDGGNNLKLLGINSFVLQNQTTNATVANGVTYIGNYITGINNFTATAVPEPASLLMLATTAAILLRRRCNQSRKRPVIEV